MKCLGFVSEMLQICYVKCIYLVILFNSSKFYAVLTVLYLDDKALSFILIIDES